MAGRLANNRAAWAPGPAIVLCSEENDRRLTFLSQCEQSAEIGVGRNENSAFIPGAIENLAVCGCLQTVIAYMDGVVPARRSCSASIADRALSTRNFTG